MALVARASKTVRNKNLLIVVMCLGFAIMFVYDGFVGYPRTNDLAVEHWRQMLKDHNLPLSQEKLAAWTSALEHWPTWNNASVSQRQEMDQIHDEAAKSALGAVKWKSPLDVTVQQSLAIGLCLAVLAAAWWLVHCQQRRCLADEQTVSPSRGVTIPWEKITVVDNRRWKKSGIVEITYVDDAGNSHRAKFDDYELERDPLLEILDRLAEKADKAEFLPKEEAAPPQSQPQVP